MRNIYLNSQVTIAAEEPASCKLGFLGEQRFGAPNWQQRFVTDIPVESGGPGSEIRIRPWPYPTKQKERCSLDKRGWCLQESLLPNRRLCFNGNEMIWECLCRRICERGHTLWESETMQFRDITTSMKFGKGDSQRVERLPTPHLPSLDRGHHFVELYRDWRAIIEEYSDRCLSRKEDKLSAVSGLAQSMALTLRSKGVSDAYQAGLWIGEFHFDLTWRTIDSETQDARDHNGQTQYHAPSWSWASVDQSVRYEFWKSISTWKYKPYLRQACTVEEVTCQNVLVDDPTSKVTAAKAVLTGPLIPVKIVSADEADEDGTWNRRDMLVQTETGQRTPVYLDTPRSLESLTDHTANISCTMRGKREAVYCFKLFSFIADVGRIGGEYLMGPETWYLVLKNSSREKGAFERIGVGILELRSRCQLFESSKPVTITVV